MKHYLGLFFALFLIVEEAPATQVVFQEDFSGYTTMSDMLASGWTYAVYNHRTEEPYFDYTFAQESLGITQMYQGYENPRSNPDRMLLEFQYRLPAAIDGDFSLTMEMSWVAPENSLRQEIVPMFLGTAGNHYTSVFYTDGNSTTQGSFYTRIYDMGSNPATYSTDVPASNNATSDGTAFVTFERIGGQLTVRSELIEANGVPVASAPATTTEVTSNDYLGVEFQIISIFFDAWAYPMGTTSVDNISFTGESTTYAEPVAVPEPATMLLLAAGLITRFVVRRRFFCFAKTLT